MTGVTYEERTVPAKVFCKHGETFNCRNRSPSLDCLAVFPWLIINVELERTLFNDADWQLRTETKTNCGDDGGYLFIAWGYDGGSRRRCLAQLITWPYWRLGWVAGSDDPGHAIPQAASMWWPPTKTP